MPLLHLRGDEFRPPLADRAEHGDPVKQLAADIAGARAVCSAVASSMSVSVAPCSMRPQTRRAQSGSGTPSDLPGAMRGPNTSSEKLPLPMTTTRSYSGQLSIARLTVAPSS